MIEISTLKNANLNYVGELNRHLTCWICGSPFLKPVTTTTCLHTFCEACILEEVSITQECPIDGHVLSVDQLRSADPIVCSLVDELLVECPNQYMGCAKNVARSQLSKHLKDKCIHSPTACKLPGCTAILPMIEMLDHQASHRLNISTPEVEMGAALELVRHLHTGSATARRAQIASAIINNWEVIEKLRGTAAARTARFDREMPTRGVFCGGEVSLGSNHSVIPHSRNTPEPEFSVVAIHDYNAVNDSAYLSFKKGDRFTIFDMGQDGWWMGTSKNGTHGFLPSTHLGIDFDECT